MKCNTKRREPTEAELKDQERRNIKSNNTYLNYASRCLLLAVRAEGFGVDRLGRFNTQSQQLGRAYIEQYTVRECITSVEELLAGAEPEYRDAADSEYAVDSYYALRRDLNLFGWNPEVELWETNPFTEADCRPASTVRERQKRADFLWYANSISFYIREMLCMAAMELHNTNGYGVDRLNRVMHPVRDRWLKLMHLYLAMDKAAVEAEMKAVLKEFNSIGLFAKEYEL